MDRLYFSFVIFFQIRPIDKDTPTVSVIGTSFNTIPGGKGANQAVAAARLGADVSLIGCIGEDHFGAELLEHLKNQGVNVDNVEPVTEKTGIASIILAQGDNNIVVVPVANHCVTLGMVEE